MPAPSEPDHCPRCGTHLWSWSDHGGECIMAWQCLWCGATYASALSVEADRRRIESEREMMEDAA